MAQETKKILDLIKGSNLSDDEKPEKIKKLLDIYQKFLDEIEDYSSDLKKSKIDISNIEVEECKSGDCKPINLTSKEDIINFAKEKNLKLIKNKKKSEDLLYEKIEKEKKFTDDNIRSYNKSDEYEKILSITLQTYFIKVLNFKKKE